MFFDDEIDPRIRHSEDVAGGVTHSHFRNDHLLSAVIRREGRIPGHALRALGEKGSPSANAVGAGVAFQTKGEQVRIGIEIGEADHLEGDLNIGFCLDLLLPIGKRVLQKYVQRLLSFCQAWH